MPGAPNTLYYGDNLDILRRYVADETVDLVYLDPPFNSARNYNVLFAEQDGTRAAAQIRVFEDTWHWDEAASASYQAVVEAGGRVAEAMRAFRVFLGDNDLLAYLSMMAPRLLELRRVLKQTGALYLHCDPTASHYLKLLLDAVFGPEKFRSEIIWKRTSAHSSAKRYGPVHDVILFYTRGEEFTWHPSHQPYDQDYVETFFEQIDADGRRWKRMDITGAGTRNGETGQPWRGIDVTAKGRHWAYPPSELDTLDASGKIHWPKSAGGMPRLKQYLDDMAGVPLQDVWTDIPPLHNLSAERLGYPTQKPVALLDRIICASSNEGDVVLDPFCGCGTTIASAQKLARRWIGIDITHLAINLIRTRLRDTYGDAAKFDVIGEPTAVEDAEELARTDPYQFQWWALGLVGARPAEQKKGRDKGIDGRLYFHDGSKETRQAIFSVKAGHITSAHVRDLVGVLTREKAELGVLISFEPPTRDMRKEAASAGFFQSAWGSHPRVQLLTVGDLLDGRKVDMPQTRGSNKTFKAAPRAKRVKEPHPELFGEE